MNTEIKNTYAFTLGREWKLSLAELFHIFGTDSYQSHSEEVAIFHIYEWSPEQIEKRFMTIGGSIRVIRIMSESTPETFPTDILSHLKQLPKTERITFALGTYGCTTGILDRAMRMKKTLTDLGYSARVVNHEQKNINAASFKKERLAKSKHEYNLIKIGEKTYLGQTLACQDIDAYVKRDIGKDRDMVVGMMPPKLVQMMINIGQTNGQKSIYDPFCGLGTTLIEAANMGYMNLYGSDLSIDMIRATKKSLADFIATEKTWQERIKAVGGTPNKDFTHLKTHIFEADARSIKKSLDAEKISKNTLIVSEGFLGDIMTPRDIGLDRVQSEREKLSSLYASFFRGLKEAEFSGNIVMSFPFWNIHGTHSYFSEIYDIIERHGFRVISLLPGEMGLNTRHGSLLYRRENQTVGREIVFITRA